MLPISTSVRAVGILFVVLWTCFTFGLATGASLETHAAVENAQHQLVPLPDQIYNDLSEGADDTGVGGTVLLYSQAKMGAELAQTAVTAATVGIDLGWAYRGFITPLRVKLLGWTGILAGGGVSVYRELQVVMPAVRRAI